VKIDAELEVWRRQWRAECEEVLPDLRERVERQTRRMRFMHLVPVFATILVAGGVTAWAVESWQRDIFVLAFAVWALFAAVWGWSLWNIHEEWRPIAQTSSAYIDLSVRRCLSRLRATVFGAIVYFCNLAFSVWWISRHTETPATTLLSPSVLIVICLVTTLVLVMLARYRRRLLSELSCLLDLQKQLRRN